MINVLTFTQPIIENSKNVSVKEEKMFLSPLLSYGIIGVLVLVITALGFFLIRSKKKR